jgi:hypothetical protein
LTAALLGLGSLAAVSIEPIGRYPFIFNTLDVVFRPGSLVRDENDTIHTDAGQIGRGCLRATRTTADEPAARI